MSTMSKEYPFISLIIICYMIVYAPLMNGDTAKEIKINSIDAQLIESLDKETLSLKGNVIIKTDLVELWSDEAIYDRHNQLIKLEGNIKALSKNLSISAENMKADFLNNEFLLSKSSFNFMERGFGKAQLISIKINEDIELLNVAISSCKKENLNWNLSADKISILADRKNIITRDIKLEVNEFPIFYLPYLRTAAGEESFSGFLTPTVKQGKDGLDLSIPYFFSLASNYDLTITPRYIEERGTGISAEGRFLTLFSEGLMGFSYFSSDRKYYSQTGNANKRWASRINSQSRLGSNTFIKINSEHVSDNLYFEDLNDDILGTQQKDYLSKSLLVRFDLKNIILQGELNQFHNLDPFSSNDYDTQPHLSVNFQKKFDTFTFRLLTDYSKFSFEETYNPLNRENNLKRIYVEPSLSADKENASSLSSFKIGRRKADYESEFNAIANSYSWAELTHRVFLDKKTKNDFRTLTPIMKIIWIDGENNYKKSIDSKNLNLNFDTLFDKNWYSGSDLFLEQNRLILGFEHNSYNPSNGVETYFSFGKAFLNDQEVDIGSKKSYLVSEFKTKFRGNIKINGSIEISPDLEKISRGHFGIIYEKNERKNIQLRSVYKRNSNYLNQLNVWNDQDLPINQIELISQWALSNNYLFFGKLSRDQEINYSRDLSYGVEYSNCCLKVGLMKRKWLDQNYYMFFDLEQDKMNLLDRGLLPDRERDNVYFFFELTELGRFGKRISEVLNSRAFQ